MKWVERPEVSVTLRGELEEGAAYVAVALENVTLGTHNLHRPCRYFPENDRLESFGRLSVSLEEVPDSELPFRDELQPVTLPPPAAHLIKERIAALIADEKAWRLALPVRRVIAVLWPLVYFGDARTRFRPVRSDSRLPRGRSDERDSGGRILITVPREISRTIDTHLWFVEAHTL